MTAVPASHGDKWHDRYPELGTGPIPIEPYISRAYFEEERERIFRRVWLNIGRIEQIPQPGDHFVTDLDVCKTSILVVRGKDGKGENIRAFHNMCSHRGNKLVWDSRGSCQAFTCQFHGWVYGLDGRLRHITKEENFFDLNKEELGMTPVAVDTWEGFIFINVDPNPTETLDEYLGETGTGLRGYPFGENSATCFSWHTELQANWKVCKDAFQEVYHISTLHHRTIGPVFASRTHPYVEALNFLLSSRHGRGAFTVNMDRQPAPVESWAQGAGWLGAQDDSVPKQLPRGVNPSSDSRWALDSCILFPNYVMYASEGTYLSHTFWPLSEDRTRWETRICFPEATTLAERFSQEYNKVVTRDTFMEDGTTLEKTQSMLASGAKKEIHLQDEELFIRQHHKVAETYLNG